MAQPRIDTTLGWSAIGGGQSPRGLSINGGGYKPPWMGTASQGGVAPPETPSGYEPMKRDQLGDLGKTMMSIVPGDATNVLDQTEEPPKKTPGFAEGFLGGMTEAFTGALPGFVRDPMVGLAKGLGSIADVPLEAIGHMPINEWVGLEDSEGAFNLLPVTNEKAVTIAQMKADPVNREWYLAQYLRTHGGDYMAAKGLPQLLAPILQPDATVLERGLMALGLPSQMVARTYAGFANRADEIINGQLAENAHPEVKALMERYTRGEYGQVGSEEARDRLLDEMTVQGFGYSNDPFISMIAEMITDPIILAGMGTGVAMKVVRTGALARRMANIGRIARTEVRAGRASAQLSKAVSRAEEMVRTGKLGTAGRFDDTYQFGRELLKDGSEDVRRIAERATRELSTADRAQVALTPLIEGAAAVSQALNEPFRIFGKDGAAGLVMKRFARNTSQGGVSAFDTTRVARLYRGVNESVQAALNDSLGYAMSYSQRSMLNSSLIKQMRTSLKDADGNMVPADWMPDALSTPDTILDALTLDKNGNPIDMRVENPGAAAQMEAFMRRVKETFVPELGALEGAARERAYRAAMEKFKDQAAEQLHYATGGQLSVAEARKLLANATDDELAFVHWLQWGRMIKDFEITQKADAAGNKGLVSTHIEAVREYESAGGRGKGPRKATDEQLRMAEIIERATLVGPRELTMEQAKAIRAKLETMKDDPAAQAAYLQEVIGTKEILYQNFWQRTRITTDKSFVAEVDGFLKTAIEDSRLVQDIKRENLPPKMLEMLEASDRRGASYEIGMAPPTNKRFSPVYNTKGELKGYNAWMDVRVSKADVATPTRFDVLRERLWTPIRAENMLQESRRKFIRLGVKEYDLDRYAATEVFDAIREASTVDRTTMRAFTPDEFARILDTVDLSQEMKQRLGKRGLAELTARALEGDIRMVGATTRLTGAMKVQTAHYGNFMGVLAEKIYPLIRFNLNPVFMMQEWVEPYFFNFLRGVKPGIKFGKDQIEFHTVLDEWNMAGVLADGFEAREFSMTGGYHAREHMGPRTVVGRLAGKMPFGRVQEVKKANYANLTKKQFGDNLHDAFQRGFPGQWERIESFFNELDVANGGNGHLSRGDVATRWYANKGMYDPNTKTTHMHHYDGAVPDDLGRIDGIRKSHLARMFGFDDIPALRRAVKDTTDPRYMDEWAFRSELVHAGMTNEYAVRAYNVAVGLDVDDILNHIEYGYSDPAMGKVARDMTDVWLRTMSEIKGITKEEYAARKFATLPKWMDASGRLPQSAFTQLSDRLIQESGFPKMEATDPRYIATKELATNMMPEYKHKKQVSHVNAATRVTEGRQRLGNGLVKERRNVGGIDLNPDIGTREFKEQNDLAGMTQEDVQGVGEWYRTVGPMFAAVAHGLDETTLRALSSVMDEYMPSAVNKTLSEAKFKPGPELGETPVPPGKIRVYHYTSAEALPSIREHGIQRSSAKGETYGEPNTIWVSTEKPDARSHDGVVEFFVDPDELDIGAPVRGSYTQAEIDDLHARGSNLTLNLDEVPPERFNTIDTPGDAGYRYLEGEFSGKVLSEDDLDMVRGAIDMGTKESEGYKRWLEDYEAANKPRSQEELANELGARMLMAWGATQVQTSPRDGFGYVLTLIDAVSRGVRPDASVLKKGQKPGPLTGVASGIGLFNLQKSQLRAMLVDFDKTVKVDGLGAKLHDFIDSLLGNGERTYMKRVDADGNPVPPQMYNSPTRGPIPMQPGAMDIWMGRDSGFVDTPYLGIMQRRLQKLDPSLTDEQAMVQAQLESGFFARKSVAVEVDGVSTRKPENVGPYRKRKAAFEKEHGLEEGALQEVWDGTPSPDQYEFMLERYNRITDELNEEGYLGRGYSDELGEAWTVADIQAIAWMRIQKINDIDPGGPTNMFQQNATQVSFEIVPGKNTPLRDAIPMHRASEDAKDLITTDVALVLADLVQERTGVQITRSVPGRGGWRGGPDDYTLSPNTFWELLGPEQAVDDALDYIAYMTQQDMVFATRPANRVGGKLPSASSDKNHWSMDFAPSVDDALTLDRLGTYLEEQGVPWNGHMVGSIPGDRSVIRTVYSPAWTGEDMSYKGTYVPGSAPEGYIDVPSGTDIDGFTKMSALPDGLEAKLRDGSWAIEAGLEDAIVVDVNRELVQPRHRYTDFAADRVRADERLAQGHDPRTVYSEEIGRDLVKSLHERGRGDVAREMVGRDLEAITQVWDQSLKDNDGNAWSVGRGKREILSYDTRGEGPYLQSSPRGWLGGTAWTRKRDATQRVASGQLGGRRGRLYLKSDDANVTTPAHELFHFFADDLDPSGVAAIHEAYYTGVKKKARPKSNNRLTVEAEEWMASQFEEYASTGIAPTGPIAAIFNAYDTMMQSIDPAVRKPNRLTDVGEKALEKVTTVQVGGRKGLRPEVKRGPAMTFDADQFRMMEAARIALQRAEEEAFTAHYYKRGRTLLERTINHPYLGLYPASYMWGKVLPELMRFLVKKPFGVDAPFAGMQMANHVWNAIQLELATDNDGSMQKLIEGFPEALRFLLLMVPGTPWDIPVNAPAWTRRMAQDAWQGKEANLGKAIGDTVSYAFGPGRAPNDAFEFLQEMQGMGGRAMSMLDGTYQTDEEKEEEEERLRFQGLQPPEEPEAPTRLVPGTGFQVSPELP